MNQLQLEVEPVAPAPVQRSVSMAKARRFYDAVTDKIRLRHDPTQGSSPMPETWEVATIHALLGMSDWEASVIFTYLRAQAGLVEVDRVLTECLAHRLDVVVEWQRKELLDEGQV